MLVLFILNNVFTTRALSPIQSKAVFFKCIYFFLLFGEVIAVICQRCVNLRRSGAQYEKVNENIRRV